MKIKNFAQKNILLIFSIVFIIIFSINPVKILAVGATPPPGGYTAGSELDPDCVPGTTDCIVVQTASNIVYDNTTSGLTATDTQTAIDEIDGVVDDINGFTIDASNNMFVGAGAGSALNLGTENIFIGIGSGQSTTDGVSNVASGYQSLFSNTLGSINNAFGYKALTLNTVGEYNNAFGDYSLSKNIDGNRNTAFGGKTLFSNTSGTDNTAVGIFTMQGNTTGGWNTAMGDEALWSNTIGNFNTAIGMGAGEYNVTGSGNVFLGHFAGLNSTDSDQFYLYNGTHFNATVAEDKQYSLMYGTFNIDPELQTLRINGDVGIGAAPAYRFSVSEVATAGVVGSFTNSDGICTLDPGDVGGWSCPSDRNLKKDITNLDLGLTQINQLRPVYYRLTKEDEDVLPSLGLIAQEVEPIFPKLVKTQLDGTLSLNYGGLTPVMIKAIQELDLKLEGLAMATTGQSVDGTISAFFDRFISWFADSANGIGEFFANKVKTKEICLTDDTGETCITKAKLDELLLNSNLEPAPAPTPATDPTPTPDPVPDTTPIPDPVPVI
jgi:hypothetical protein